MYVAKTVGNQCNLASSIAKDAGGAALKQADKFFKNEAQCLAPAYSPTTINMDR